MNESKRWKKITSSPQDMEQHIKISSKDLIPLNKNYEGGAFLNGQDKALNKESKQLKWTSKQH